MSKHAPDKPQALTIVAGQPRLVQITYRITGDKTLLMNKCEGRLSRTRRQTVNSSIPTKEDEAEAGAYRTDGGQLYIKPEAFQGSIISSRGGASGVKFGKATAGAMVSAGVDFLVEEQCPLFHPKTEAPIRSYRIDERPVVVQKARVLRARPAIDEWACNLTVEIDERYMTILMLESLLNASGKMAGVGDYRPQRKGRFGKYHAAVIPSSVAVLHVFDGSATEVEIEEETE